MPSNKSWLPPVILRFLDSFNFARISPAAAGIHKETRQLDDKITAPNAVVRNQPSYYMEVHAGETKLIALLTRMLARQPHDRHPMKVLDIGTFTGQSALAMAENLPADGKVISCDLPDPPGETPRRSLQIAEKYWKEAGVRDRIDLRLAKAEDTLNGLLADGQAGTFDLVFIDADKGNYRQYYEKALQLLRPGGLVMLDNMLWSTQVPDMRHKDDDTTALRRLASDIRLDRRVDPMLLEIEDGVIIAEKCAAGAPRHNAFIEQTVPWAGSRKAGTSYRPEEIAIIGGGLSGCMAALMLSRESVIDPHSLQEVPRYHINLLEKNDILLGGSSSIASRLHLGGEYPRDPATRKDCLESGVIWKLLMPRQEDKERNIYTPVPPMKFLLSRQTQESGVLTLQKYLDDANWQLHHPYRLILNKLKAAGMLNPGKALFGPSGAFVRPLGWHEFQPYDRHHDITGGFQTQEPGLNIPKYLAMIQQELEARPNITIRTNCTVKDNGITGDLGHYEVHCEGHEKPVAASQVIMAGWQGNPAIAQHLLDGEGKSRNVAVHKRAMLRVDLPEGWNIPPAFIMEGRHGGMLSPFNDKTAICYIPADGAAYIDSCELSDRQRTLPQHWNDWPRKNADGQVINKDEWTQRYFNLAKKRFPVLEQATNPHLIVHDTLNFQTGLHQRRDEAAFEVTQQQGGAAKVKRGLFALYLTKATYAVRAAVQLAAMVNERSMHPDREQTVAFNRDTLDFLMEGRHMSKYSLVNMRPPEPGYMENFLARHHDLQNMEIESWPEQRNVNAAADTQGAKKRAGWAR